MGEFVSSLQQKSQQHSPTAFRVYNKMSQQFHFRLLDEFGMELCFATQFNICDRGQAKNIINHDMDFLRFSFVNLNIMPQ
jgi:hypothetical protein